MKNIIMIFVLLVGFTTQIYANFLGTFDIREKEFIGCVDDPTNPKCKSLVSIGCDAFCYQSRDQQSEKLQKSCKTLCPRYAEFQENFDKDKKKTS
jgi:hypothetical protein